MRVLLTCPPMILRLREMAIDPELDIIVPIFKQTMSEDELVELLPTVDAWIIGDDPATRRVFESSRGTLRCVVKWGVGIDNVDIQALTDFGIPFTNTPALFGESVSDVAIGMLLMMTRGLHHIHEGVKTLSWPKPCGIDLNRKTVCILGLGCIGQAVARKLNAFGCDVRAVDPAFHMEGTEAVSDRDRVPSVTMRDTLSEAAAGARILIITCSLNDRTRGIVDKAVMSRMAPRGILVNVSRGPVLVERDLVDELAKGTMHGACLDVFDVEPLPH